MARTEAQKEERRQQREADAVRTAKELKRAVTYIDDDGCEVTATPNGHTFYNATDWW